MTEQNRPLPLSVLLLSVGSWALNQARVIYTYGWDAWTTPRGILEHTIAVFLMCLSLAVLYLTMPFLRSVHSTVMDIVMSVWDSVDELSWRISRVPAPSPLDDPLQLQAAYLLGSNESYLVRQASQEVDLKGTDLAHSDLRISSVRCSGGVPQWGTVTVYHRKATFARWLNPLRPTWTVIIDSSTGWKGTRYFWRHSAARRYVLRVLRENEGKRLQGLDGAAQMARLSYRSRQASSERNRA